MGATFESSFLHRLFRKLVGDGARISDDAARLVVALANDVMRRIGRGIARVNRSGFTRDRNGIDITDCTRIMFSEFDFSSDLDRIGYVAVTAVFVDGSGR